MTTQLEARHLEALENVGKGITTPFTQTCETIAEIPAILRAMRERIHAQSETISQMQVEKCEVARAHRGELATLRDALMSAEGRRKKAPPKAPAVPDGWSIKNIDSIYYLGEVADSYGGMEICAHDHPTLHRFITALLDAAPAPQPAAVPANAVDLIIRDICELEPGPLEMQSLVIDSTETLRIILERHLIAAPEPARCPYCDDTGDVHSPTGEYRGRCTCAVASAPAPSLYPSSPDHGEEE